MPSWPTALGGMFAAGYAATQAHKVGYDAPAIVTNALKNFGSDTASSSGRTSGGSELSVLQGEVDRLHKLLSDVVRGRGGGSVQVIHSGRGGWSFLILPTAVVGVGVFAYAKVRGLGFADFFMVTNKSLQQFRELVSHSMTQLWEEVRKQKDELIARISAVGQQQEQMLVQQGQMGDKLQDVSASVDDIRDISSTIEARVGQMDHTINIMSSGVQRANEGIYLLCAAVADVTRRVGVDNSKLKVYVQTTAPEITDGNPGLRHLLENIGGGAEAAGGALTIMEVAEGGADAGEVAPAAPTPRNGSNSSRLGSVDSSTALLYRRDSARAEPGRSLMGFGGSIWGGGAAAAPAGAATGGSGNRGRAASATPTSA
ncbi:hypothetical protein TSOC_004902 [Tetrabaena socialis]|uniref:DUF1664 domain-containing protein n=1 Tax=Tetrabaena socialis TaxID=47790 RepID=A0A2J8A7Q6_9CHLO|nr:hypothetical protein TSOC_004902 [Tetrabaena socialis]|eukprot:PNH08535.1 hypothetical protein TSOC_004902 [Tetrabaena socialis]